MKNIYAGTFGAFILEGKEYIHKYRTGSVVCPSQREAEILFLQLAYTEYPSKYGWYQHYAEVAEIPASQIHEYLKD